MSYDSPAPSVEEPDEPITETTESESSTDSAPTTDADPSTEKEA